MFMFLFLVFSVFHYGTLIGSCGAVFGTASSQYLGPSDGLARSKALFFGATALIALQAGITIDVHFFDEIEGHSQTFLALFMGEILLIGWGLPITIDMEHDISHWWETLLISVMVSPVIAPSIFLLNVFWYVSLPVLAFITIKLGIRMSRLKTQLNAATRTDQSSQQMYCAVVTESAHMETELPILTVV